MKSPLLYAAAMAAITALAVAVIAFAPDADAAEPIKQSRSGICWCPGTGSYDRVSNFTAFDSIEACLAADGRHPKRDQGDCPTAAEASLLELRASVEALSLRVAALEAADLAAPTGPPTRSKLQTYNFCSAELGKDDGLWDSDVDKYCQGVTGADVDDFVSCFTTQRGNGAWGSEANKRCRSALGID